MRLLKQSQLVIKGSTSLQFDTKIFRRKLSRFLGNNVTIMISQSEEYAKTVRKDHQIFSEYRWILNSQLLNLTLLVT